MTSTFRLRSCCEDHWMVVAASAGSAILTCISIPEILYNHYEKTKYEEMQQLCCQAFSNRTSMDCQELIRTYKLKNVNKLCDQLSEWSSDAMWHRADFCVLLAFGVGIGIFSGIACWKGWGLGWGRRIRAYCTRTDYQPIREDTEKAQTIL